MRLEETGLPARYYIPAEDIDTSVLAPSDRKSVCTYKGEATYHHLHVGDTTVENAVWTYAEPWTDFAADIGKLKGHRGVYASVFDRVLLDGADITTTEDADFDRAMIARPTIDRVLNEKQSG